MAVNDLVRSHAETGVHIYVYEVADGFVAADQAGWLEGSWPTADEALEAVRKSNGLT